MNLFVEDNLIYSHNVDDAGNSLGAPYWAPAPGGAQWPLIEIKAASVGPITQLGSEPVAYPVFPRLPATRVETYLLANSGARSAYRDTVDQRVVDDIASRIPDRGYGTSGGYVSDPDEVGGYPPWTLVTRSPGIALPSNPNLDPDGDTYTNLEEWLHTLAFRLEGDARNARFDTFEDNAADGWIFDSAAANWSVVTDGTTRVLNQSSTAADSQAFLLKSYFYDQVVQAKVKITDFVGSNRFARLYARYRDVGNAYYVTLRTNNTVELKKLDNGTPVLLTTSPAFPVNTTDWYSVRLSAVGGALTATVRNLTTSASVTVTYNDPNPLPPGFAAIGTNFASARFDDVFAGPTGTSIPQLTEDFDDGNAMGWTPTGGTWSVATDGSKIYRQMTNTASLLARSAWNTTVSGANQSVQASVKPLSFNPTSFVSVHARYIDGNNNYYVTLRDTNVFELKKVENGHGETLQGGDDAGDLRSPEVAYDADRSDRYDRAGPHRIHRWRTAADAEG